MDMDTAEYIHDMAHQLAEMAAANGLMTLAAILELAEAEAEILITSKGRSAPRIHCH